MFKPMLLLLACLGAAADAATSPEAGHKLATAHCAACHSFDKNGPHGQGPNLFGLLGRPAGSAFGFRYSTAFMAAMRGQSWDRALLERWLTDTQQVAPGNNMLYLQDDPKKRKLLLDYLETLK
jgi:cytochrome c